ncbi:alpha-amylase [Actinoplanes capillaceus]|uniref:Alpha-amylase n=1 Tax=Actinoplanes campanulatus TaxID=113559 RepID=A0ABQ3W8R2_9ACTN|nr:alpha-amylase family glycosyl hydrolase [Actinoplanes capillaceus]GID42969.1 alpha-amylase [Actinoplanes capillaceus]
MSNWADHAIWWHVYPLGFTGGLHRGPGHRFGHLVDWLDYAVEMGVNGLQLGPVFASGTHGYDTVDHFRIDPRLGDDADFDELVAAAGSRGVRVMLDGVFNHVGRGFSAPRHWFRHTGPGPEDVEVFEGHDALVALDHGEPEVLDHVVRVMNHWLDRGVSGWRLDAAYAVPPRFWRAAVDRVRSRHPEAWFTGELIHGDYPAYLRESGLDSITQYELWKAIWSSLNDRNLFELVWALERHGEVLGAGLPLTFVGNHDVTRIASRLDDVRHLGHALAVLFTTGGAPSIYYGDEQAYRGVKQDRAGGDDDVRPLFPAKPEDLSAYGWPTYRLHQRLIGLRRRHPWLTHARTESLSLTNTAAALVSTAPGNRLITLLNVGDTETTFDIDVAGLRVLEGDGATPGTVPAHGWQILG